MSAIEGVGDEVIQFMIGLVVVLIGIAAWWSTRITYRPFIRTLLVFERRRSHHVPAQQSSSLNNNEQVVDSRVEPEAEVAVEGGGADDSVPVTVRLENKPSTAAGASSADIPGNTSTTTATEDERSSIVQSMDQTESCLNEACVLRRRRLEFFRNRSDSSLAPLENDFDDSAGGNAIPNTEEVVVDGNNENHDNDNSSSADSINTTETTIDENDIRIKLKYINDDIRLVSGKLHEPLGDFKRRNFESEIANDKLVRLIFNGQMLQRDEISLQSCGFFDNCVVHCLIHQKRNTDLPAARNLGASDSPGRESFRVIINNHHHGHGNGQPAREWDLGNVFLTVLSFILGAAWYFRYEYAQLYTVTATVALVGLTGIFTVLLVGMYFPDSEQPTPPTARL